MISDEIHESSKPAMIVIASGGAPNKLNYFLVFKGLISSNAPAFFSAERYPARSTSLIRPAGLSRSQYPSVFLVDAGQFSHDVNFQKGTNMSVKQSTIQHAIGRCKV